MKCLVRQVQCNPKLGDWDANLSMHLEAIDGAIRDGKQLVLFPELSLTGYFLKDQTHEVALEAHATAFAPLLERSRSISIVAGFIERARDGRLYNATGFFEDGKLLGIHRKVHLVTYGMFEDGRDFAPGLRFEPIRSRHGMFGILACEDMWHFDGAYLYFLDGVDALLVASASPGRGVTTAPEGEAEPSLASNRVWRTIQDHAALQYQTPVLYTNRVGFEDGVLFGGGTRALDALAEPMGSLEHFDEGLLDSELCSEKLKRARAITPLRRDERLELFERELARRVQAQRDTQG
ncbi:MAG TPA: nitrilase-related carbon-nitrogen hydrolase [Planctomycetota bacterium]|nr:nitrilase-related carbon-nitrogen hydrolase [Planctomycetota bacterium]HRV80268.1 nitrilase-related carbon-nitrogen hydrolase [Planctomycetota bacterium]